MKTIVWQMIFVVVVTTSAVCHCPVASAINPVSTVHLSLNLSFSVPANQSLGGNWTLVAKTDDPLGISAINFIANHLDNGPNQISIANDIGAVDPTFGRPAIITFNGGIGTDVIFGQDLTQPGFVPGVGTLATSDGPDQFGIPFWDDATIIATGTFGAIQPSFTNNGSSFNDANVFTNVTVPGAERAADIVTTVVRIPEPSMLTLGGVALIATTISRRSLLLVVSREHAKS